MEYFCEENFVSFSPIIELTMYDVANRDIVKTMQRNSNIAATSFKPDATPQRRS